MNTISRRLEFLQFEPSPDRRSRTIASVVPRDSRVEFATISDVDAFEALAPEWSVLFEESGKPHQLFQAFEWLSIWATIYAGPQMRLAIVTARIDGHLVLVWPLVMHRVVGIRVLSGMGEPLTQYTDALLSVDLAEKAADAAVDYVMALPVDVIALRRVRADAAIAPALRRRLGAAVNGQASPFVDLSDAPSAEAFDARFSGKLRASRRRRRRRIEERGAVTFAHHGPSVEAAALVTKALEFKRDWARRAGVLAPALRDPRFEAFFVAAARASCKAPDLRISALRCGAELLGVEISMACKGHLFGHVLAPCPGLGPLGVGGVLAESIIRNARDLGYRSVDLLAPADPYKMEWTTSSVEVGDYCVSRSLRGALYKRLWLCFGREALKTIVGRLRPGIATLRRRLKQGRGPEDGV